MTAALRGLTMGTERLLDESLALAPQVNNMRLALEIGVIQTYRGKDPGHAEDARSAARTRPPEQMEIIGFGLSSLAGGLLRRAEAQALHVGPSFASLT